LVIYPFILRPYLKAKDATTIIISFLVAILTFTPAMLLNSLPFNKEKFQSHTIVVKHQYSGRSGASAAKYYLKTTSWRAKSTERFQSDFNIFSHYQKGDRVTIKIGKDTLGHSRVITISK